MPEFKVLIHVTADLTATRCFTIVADTLTAALDIADAAIAAGADEHSVTLGGVTYEIPDVVRAIHGFDEPDGWDCNDGVQMVEAESAGEVVPIRP